MCDIKIFDLVESKANGDKSLYFNTMWKAVDSNVKVQILGGHCQNKHELQHEQVWPLEVALHLRRIF